MRNYCPRTTPIYFKLLILLMLGLSLCQSLKITKEVLSGRDSYSQEFTQEDENQNSAASFRQCLEIFTVTIEIQDPLVLLKKPWKNEMLFYIEKQPLISIFYSSNGQCPLELFKEQDKCPRSSKDLLITESTDMFEYSPSPNGQLAKLLTVDLKGICLGNLFIFKYPFHSQVCHTLCKASDITTCFESFQSRTCVNDNRRQLSYYTYTPLDDRIGIKPIEIEINVEELPEVWPLKFVYKMECLVCMIVSIFLIISIKTGSASRWPMSVALMLFSLIGTSMIIYFQYNSSEFKFFENIPSFVDNLRVFKVKLVFLIGIEVITQGVLMLQPENLIR